MTITIHPNEIIETIKMIETENLDIRTITLGISLRDCTGQNSSEIAEKIYEKIVNKAGRLVAVGDEIQQEFGVPIINKRISVTPISLIGGLNRPEDYIEIAKSLDKAAKEVGVDFLGGFSALVHKGVLKKKRL